MRMEDVKLEVGKGYGLVGSNFVIFCQNESDTLIASTLDNAIGNIVEMKEGAGSWPGKHYVVSKEGTWEIDPKVSYRDIRQTAIAEAIPVHEQLEALTDAVRILLNHVSASTTKGAGNSKLKLTGVEKFESIMQRLEDIKKQYPKKEK